MNGKWDSTWFLKTEIIFLLYIPRGYFTGHDGNNRACVKCMLGFKDYNNTNSKTRFHPLKTSENTSLQWWVHGTLFGKTQLISEQDLFFDNMTPICSILFLLYQVLLFLTPPKTTQIYFLYTSLLFSFLFFQTIFLSFSQR